MGETTLILTWFAGACCILATGPHHSVVVAGGSLVGPTKQDPCANPVHEAGVGTSLGRFLSKIFKLKHDGLCVQIFRTAGGNILAV